VITTVAEGDGLIRPAEVGSIVDGIGRGSVRSGVAAAIVVGTGEDPVVDSLPTCRSDSTVAVAGEI